jgi:hypothetical protein
MSRKTIYFFVYRITNIVTGKHYYGYKSSSKHPTEVIGKTYFSSMKGKEGEEFISNQKNNPQNFKYKIIKIFDDKNSALALEIKLHAKFNVAKNPKFYNRSNQTTTGFDTTGIVRVKDKEGNTFSVSVLDERYILGELVSVFKNMVLCVDEYGNNVGFINKNDQRYGINFFPRKIGFCKSGKTFSKSHKEKLAKAAKGKPKSSEHIKNLKASILANGSFKGNKHPKFKYWYRTPWGIFDSPAALEPKFTMTRMKMFCLKSDSKLSKVSYNRCSELQELFDTTAIGKSFRELGFWVIPKDEYDPSITY